MNYVSLEERRFFLGLDFLKVVIQKAMSYLCIMDSGEWLRPQALTVLGLVSFLKVP